MQFYEIIFILRQDIITNEINELLSLISDTLEEYNNKILNTEHWGMRNLSYEIKNNKKGYYIMLYVEANTDGLNELSRKMKFNSGVIRFFIHKVNTPHYKPSPIFKKIAEENLQN